MRADEVDDDLVRVGAVVELGGEVIAGGTHPLAGYRVAGGGLGRLEVNGLVNGSEVGDAAGYNDDAAVAAKILAIAPAR